jgi:hypothetical protein
LACADFFWHVRSEGFDLNAARGTGRTTPVPVPEAGFLETWVTLTITELEADGSRLEVKDYMREGVTKRRILEGVKKA